MTILILVNENLVEECFNFLNIFTQELIRNQNVTKSSETQCYEENLYLYLNKIILILLQTNMNKTFYVDYI